MMAGVKSLGEEHIISESERLKRINDEKALNKSILQVSTRFIALQRDPSICPGFAIHHHGCLELPARPGGSVSLVVSESKGPTDAQRHMDMADGGENRKKATEHFY